MTPSNPPSTASLKLTESLDPILEQLVRDCHGIVMEQFMVLDRNPAFDRTKYDILQAFATAIGQIELPEKREGLSLTKFPFAAGQADGWNDMRENCQAVIEEFRKELQA